MRYMWSNSENASLRFRLRNGELARQPDDRGGQSLEEREPDELSRPVGTGPDRELIGWLLESEAAQRID